MSGLIKPMVSATRKSRATDVEVVDTSQWGTPEWLTDWVQAMKPFHLDVCASAANAKHPRFFDAATNGLQQRWEAFWMNPPYGSEIGRWVKKARNECIDNRTHGWCLVPRRDDAEWWEQYVLQGDGEAGRHRMAKFIPQTRTLWLGFDDLIVGITTNDRRIRFVGAKDDAPFVTAMVLFAHPDVVPGARLAETMYDDKGRPLPEITLGWPR